MSIEQNKALVRRFVEEVFNRHDLSVMDELVTDDGTVHGLPPGTPPTHAALRQGYQAAFEAFPDLHVTIEDLIAEGDKTVLRFTESGTHTGEFMGIAATGKRWTSSGIGISRIVDGKFVETWMEQDALGFFQQIGAIPNLGQVPA